MTNGLNIGDKVYYTAPHGTKENGIIKSVSGRNVFVVYNCDDQWDKFMDYTGCATNPEDLTVGWTDEAKNKTKKLV